jgi:hypothetical protein
MTNLITGLIGLALMIAFLGILLVWIKAIPLIIIVVSVVILAVIDFVRSLRTNGAAR